MSFDPSKMNAKTAISKIKRLTDSADLESAKAAEEAGSSRKTVLAAIAETLVKVPESAAEEAESAAASEEAEAEAAAAQAAQEAAEAAAAAQAAEEARAAAEAAAAAASKEIVHAPPNKGTVGLVTKVFHGRNVIIK